MLLYSPLLLCSLLNLVSSIRYNAPDAYHGYTVYSLYPKTVEQLNVARFYKRKLDALDYWYFDENRADVMVKPELKNDFVKTMYAANFTEPNFYLRIKNVAQYMNNFIIKFPHSSLKWNKYHTVYEIFDWMRKMSFMNNSNVELLKFGYSNEDTDLIGVKISFNKTTDGISQRKGIFLEGGAIAREWMTSEVLLFIINALLTSTDARFRKVAEKFDWYIFPVVNPDGKRYSHEYDRSWVKTRENYSMNGKDCYGANPSLNWDIHWGVGIKNMDPNCKDIGPYQFSEESTNSLAINLRDKLGENLFGYISFLSNGQKIMHPHGYTKNKTKDSDVLRAIALDVADKIQKKHQALYEVGSVADLIGITGGLSTDYVKDNFAVPLVYTMYLRKGYDLPPSKILPQCEEMLDAITDMLYAVDNKGLLKFL